MEGVHVWHNDCLWCVDGNENFKLPIWPQNQKFKVRPKWNLPHGSWRELPMEGFISHTMIVYLSSTFVSIFYLPLLAQSTPGSTDLKFEKKIFQLCFWLHKECPELLSFSIDIAPQWILWKRSREVQSLRASRHSNSMSSSISPTLLVFRHFLQVQRAAAFWTFSTWLIWSFELGLQMGASYSSLCQTKVLYTTFLVLSGATAYFLRRKPNVLVALEEISEMCWTPSILSEMVIPRYLLTERFPNIDCEENSQRVFVCIADAESLS